VPINPINIDPTYLRSIYDGLISGALFKDNASALPAGLVGIYEEALPPESLLNERKLVLEFFTVWALLKKEVSAAFVAPLLGWTEDQILFYIARYSKWFNSFVGGKYILYHERLRSFILQKVSNAHFIQCNQSIIAHGKDALERCVGDEWEYYALEYQSTHLLIQSMETGITDDLKAWAYSNRHWNRQVELSKGFDWSTRMLQEMMFYSSRYDEDEVILCAINIVDLFKQEQNDARCIVRLINQHDTDTALQRIGSFGGNDQKGFERKFILYILCLLELTLLGKKRTPKRKVAIEKLLRHMDENLFSLDHSDLISYDLLPSYLMFQLACEIYLLDLDYLVILKHTGFENIDWLDAKGPYSDLQFEVLKSCILSKNDDSIKIKNIQNICHLLAKQNKMGDVLILMKKAHEFARCISRESRRGNELKSISIKYLQFGYEAIADSIMQEALGCVHGMFYEDWELDILNSYCILLATTQKFQEAIICARNMPSLYWRSVTMMTIAISSAQYRNSIDYEILMEEALNWALEIENEHLKCQAINLMSTELASNNMTDQAQLYVNKISDENFRWLAIKQIAIKHVSQLRIKEGIDDVRNLIQGNFKITALMEITIELNKIAHFEEAFSLILEAYSYAQETKDIKEKIGFLTSISSVMISIGRIEYSQLVMNEALELSQKLDDLDRILVTREILAELANRDDVNRCANLIIDYLKYDGVNSDYYSKIKFLTSISGELTKREKFDEATHLINEAFNYAKKISYYDDMIISVKNIVSELAAQRRYEDALTYTQSISDEFACSQILQSISNHMIENADSKLAINCAQSIKDDYCKSGALLKISQDFFNRGNLIEAVDILNDSLEVAMGIVDDDCFGYWRFDALMSISTEQVRQGNYKDCFDTITKIKDKNFKSNALKLVSCEFANNLKFEQALNCIKDIHNEFYEIEASISLARAYFKIGNCEEAINKLDDCIEDAFNIKDLIDRSNALMLISEEIAIQGSENKAIELALSIEVDYWRVKAIQSVIRQLSKINDLVTLETIVGELPIKISMKVVWENLAKESFDEKGSNWAFGQTHQLKSSENKVNYLRGLNDSLSPADASKDMIVKVLYHYIKDSKSMERILQRYVLHDLFLNNTSGKFMERLHRSLDIQWAIEIKNSFCTK